MLRSLASRAKQYFSLGLLLATLATSSVHAQDKQRKRPIFSPFFETGITLGNSNRQDLSVQDIPEAFRDIPIHPTDKTTLSKTYPGIVPDQTLIITNFEKSYHTAHAAAGIALFDLLRVGARASMIGYGNDSAEKRNVSHYASSAGTNWKDRDYVARRNYATSNPLEKRVSGTAFTYYGFPAFSEDFPDNISTSVFAEAQYVNHAIDLGLAVGYAYTVSPKITMERGWDRWNSFQVMDHQNLGRVATNEYYARIFLRPELVKNLSFIAHCTGGMRTKDYDKGLTVNMDDQWFLEMGFTLLLGKTKK